MYTQVSYLPYLSYLDGTPLTKGNTIVMITFCYGITRRDLEGYELKRAVVVVIDIHLTSKISVSEI